MPNDPFGQFISDCTSLGGYSVRNTKRAAVILVSPVWLTYLKSALLCSLISINNSTDEVIGSKYGSKEKHQYIHSHDNYCKRRNDT